jgi:hypothetical protein
VKAQTSIADFYGWTAQPSPEAAKAALRSEFPDWSIIHTDRDRWWAIRYPILNRSGWPANGHAITEIDTDTAEELAATLRRLATGPGQSGATR